MDFNSLLIGSEDPARLVEYYTKVLGEPAMIYEAVHRLAARQRLRDRRTALRGPRQERHRRAGSSGTSRRRTSRATSSG